MRVYEIGGWKWTGDDLPTNEFGSPIWKGYKAKTCVDAEDEFGYCDKKYFFKRKWKIISAQEFYKIQNITPEQIKEINDYFDSLKE